MISREEAFNELDLVETDFSGRWTAHIIRARYLTRGCESGVTYQVVPAVPKSGGIDAKIDHKWFTRVGRVVLDGHQNFHVERYPE